MTGARANAGAERRGEHCSERPAASVRELAALLVAVYDEVDLLCEHLAELCAAGVSDGATEVDRMRLAAVARAFARDVDASGGGELVAEDVAVLRGEVQAMSVEAVRVRDALLPLVLVPALHPDLDERQVALVAAGARSLVDQLVPAALAQGEAGGRAA